MGNSNPCITCGACCAFFRASFYWTESDLATPGGVPRELTDHLQGHFLVMKGTNSPAPRCIALAGRIGGQVRCTIYEKRSTACRNFSPSWEDGATENERCANARGKWGLPALHAACWPRNDGQDEPGDNESCAAGASCRKNNQGGSND